MRNNSQFGWYDDTIFGRYPIPLIVMYVLFRAEIVQCVYGERVYIQKARCDSFIQFISNTPLGLNQWRYNYYLYSASVVYICNEAKKESYDFRNLGWNGRLPSPTLIAVDIMISTVSYFRQFFNYKITDSITHIEFRYIEILSWHMT